jgi:pimeloyl-ACP methyl ester carboxylesterase
MTAPALPALDFVRPPRPQPGARNAIVLVHGIFSSHKTFDFLLDSFSKDARFETYDLLVYDYDWGLPIVKNGDLLRDRINGWLRGATAQVTLIGHSMGGLVSRFAVIRGDMPSVRRVVMLGTPNFGALTARQLSVLLQVSVAAGGKATPFFARKAGLLDLTRVHTIFRETKARIPGAATRARNVEYITFPGMFYHGDRSDTDPGPDAVALPFTGLTIALKLFSLFPGFRVELDKPHDGIVKESSVCLIPRSADHFSEKSSAIEEPARFGRSYGHITPESALESTHMLIQRDSYVADAIKGVLLAGNVVQWASDLTLEERENYRLAIPG